MQVVPLQEYITVVHSFTFAGCSAARAPLYVLHI